MSHCFLMMMNLADSISRIPSIEIYDICDTEEDIILQKIAQLRNAAIVRSLKGCFVGLALYHGDDTHPHLWNWETNELSEIKLPICSTNNPLPLVSFQMLDLLGAHPLIYFYFNRNIALLFTLRIPCSLSPLLCICIFTRMGLLGTDPNLSQTCGL